MWWTQLVLGMYIVTYFVFCVFSVWMVLTAKIEPNKPLGKFIKYHGYAVIIVFVSTAVLTMSIIMSGMVMKALSLGGF